MSKICKIKEISHMNYEIATDRFKVVFEDMKGNLIERIFTYKPKITKSKKPTLFIQMCLACGYSKVPKNIQDFVGQQVKINIYVTKLSCYPVVDLKKINEEKICREVSYFFAKESEKWIPYEYEFANADFIDLFSYLGEAIALLKMAQDALRNKNHVAIKSYLEMVDILPTTKVGGFFLDIVMISSYAGLYLNPVGDAITPITA